MLVKLGPFPQGYKLKNHWNHHLVFVWCSHKICKFKMFPWELLQLLHPFATSSPCYLPFAGKHQWRVCWTRPLVETRSLLAFPPASRPWRSREWADSQNAPLPRGAGQRCGPESNSNWLVVELPPLKTKECQMGSSMINSHHHLCNHQLEDCKPTTSTIAIDTAIEQCLKPWFYSTTKSFKLIGTRIHCLL